jgi:MFS family permease
MRVLTRLLRWILEVDHPLPTWGEPERLAYQRRWLRWNFTVNVLEGAAFWFGMSFASFGTILPLFISKLTDSKLALGAAGAIAGAGWALPQLFTANYVERLARKKAVVVNLGFFTERLPIWLFPLAALVAGSHPGLALALVLAGEAGHCLGAGVVATGWQDMLANCFPVDVRGRLLGLMVFIGAGAGLLGAKLSAWLLATYPFPTNFALTFALGALGIGGSFVLLALTREPVQPQLKPRQTHREFFATLPALVRADPNLRAFLTARVLMVLGGMGYAFLTVSAIQRFGLPDSAAAWFTAASLAGQMLGNLACGLIADRRGHKWTMQVGVSAAAVAYALAALAPSAGWYHVVFFLLGVASGAYFVSGILLVLELAIPERRATYVGLVNTTVGLVGVLGPLLGAALARAGYGWVFALGALCQAAGVAVLTLRVREPRDG